MKRRCQAPCLFPMQRVCLVVKLYRVDIWNESSEFADKAMDIPKEILTLLKILISPDSTQSDSTVPDCERIDSSLKNNISSVEACLESLFGSYDNIRSSFDSFCDKCYTSCILLDSGKKSSSLPKASTLNNLSPEKSSNIIIRWEFVKCILMLLHWLKCSVEEALETFEIEHKGDRLSSRSNPEHQAPNLRPDVLSFEQQTCLLTSCQFIACLGICPALLPGIGIPIEKRSGFAQHLKNTKQPNLSRTEWDSRLWLCMRVILECVQVPSIGSVILSRHLSDILAGLLQLSQPIRKAEKEKTFVSKDSNITGSISKELKVGNTNDGDNLLSGQDQVSALSGDYHITMSDRRHAQEELHKLELRILQPVLVRELLLLQGGASPRDSTQGVGAFCPPPVWLRRICGKMLSNCLVRKQGVLSVIGSILGNRQADSTSVDLNKCDVAAKIIAGCPTFADSQEQYLKIVAPQIIRLLHSKDKLNGARYVHLAGHTISYMTQQNTDLTQKFLIQPLLNPLSSCTQDFGEVTKERIIVDEGIMEQCISDIHNLFILCTLPDPEWLMNSLVPLLESLFRLYCFMVDGVFHQKKLVEEILMKSLQQPNTTEGVAALKFCALGEKQPDSNLKPQNKHVTFVAGHQGGVVAILIPPEGCGDVDDWEKKASCIVNLIQKANNQELTAQLFIMCLQFLTQIVSKEVGEELEGDMAHRGPTDVMPDIESFMAGDDMFSKLQKNLTILNILHKMCEVLGPDCLKNTSHIIDFVESTLQRSVLILDHTDEMAFGVFEGETIAMALGLLSAIIDGEGQMTSDDYSKSQKLLPLLQRIADSHPDPNMKELAFNLRVSLATHGHVNVGSSKVNFEEDSKTEHNSFETSLSMMDTLLKNARDNSLIEEIPQSSENLDSSAKNEINSKPVEIEEGQFTQNDNGDYVQHNSTSPIADGFENLKISSATNASSGNVIGKEKFSDVLKDLKDPLLPIRGHALIALRHLIENRDLETLQKKDLVLGILMDNVNHSDSYIYLGAIQGLAALAFIEPSKVMRVLMDEFNCWSKSSLHSGSKSEKSAGNTVIRSTNVRLKIGEVLVKTSKTLGEMMPAYRDLLLTGFLHGTKDPDHHIRASSLSNMGEVCKHLRYSLGGHIYEVVECVGALLKTDSEIVVRRAAAMFTTTLLQGLGSEALKVLDQAIKDLYHLLKLVSRSDKDDVVQLHVQLALEELDRIMKDFIFPQQTLQKKIHVVSPPPGYS